MKTSNSRPTLTVFLLFLGSLSLWPQGQAPPSVESTSKGKGSHAAASTKSAPPAEPSAPAEVIRVGKGEMPVTEIVPGTEGAQSRLQEILGKTKDPALLNLQQSLNDLSARLAKSRDESLYLVQNARSTEQLLATRNLWQRNRQELEKMNGTVRSYVQALTENQSQVRDIQETWSVADESAEMALPEGLAERIQQVRQTAATASAAVQSTLELLVKVQVEISKDREIVDNVLAQIDAAEEGLRAGLFVLDSPPLWSALHGNSYASLRRQVHITQTTIWSRTREFYFSYRNNLLAYCVLLLVLTAAFFRLRVSQERQAAEQASIPQRLLQRPFSLATVTVLFFLFWLFFPKAPPEVFRISRFLLIFPLLRLALVVFEDELRRPMIVLSIFYALDHVSTQSTAGTLLRRLLVLFLTAAVLAGLAWLLRRRSPVASLLARKHWSIVGMLAPIALICLGVSFVSNIVGAVSLANLLMHGTLLAIYFAMAAYVLYLVLGSLISLLATTRIGQTSRLIRLHHELVLARVDTLVRLGTWILWVAYVLVGFQITGKVLAGFRSVLNYKWALGAASISIRDLSFFFLVLFVAVSVAKAIRFFLEEELLPRTGVTPGAAQSGSRLAYYTLVSIGFFLAWAAAGLDLGRLTLLTGAFGVGLGFGLQSLVGNFVSGIVISFERPMRVGDVIEMGNLFGTVAKIGFRSSTVRTPDGADVIVPNSELVTKSFVNWSLTDDLRRGELRVSVASGTDPARVFEILAKVAGSHPAVVKHPEPLIIFQQFGDGALGFSLYFWSRVERVFGVRSDLNLLVAEELGKHGIPARSAEQYVHVQMAEATGEESRQSRGSLDALPPGAGAFPLDLTTRRDRTG
jgi:potassium-dependent mechanosensitive channel